MCGIVGYTGPKTATPILIDGLKRLEYRGYDSAGICLADKSLNVIRTVGKVRTLEDRVKELGLPTEHCGIAHTRWATHGAPSEANAHPHTDDKKQFAVVHNGIIDNYASLRKKLEAQGHRFSSDTDSEVIPQLIAEFYQGDFCKAVTQALSKVSGTYGLAITSIYDPGVIVVARYGSPIVIGFGNGCNLVASDITALVPYTREVSYLNDGEMAILSSDKVEMCNLDNVPIEKRVATIDWDVEATGKGSYEHFMIKEIHEQPDAIGNTIRGRLNHQLDSTRLGGLNMTPHDMAKINRIVIAGCGSSMHAGWVGEYYFEEIARIPTEVEQAAEFRYRNPIITPDTLVLPISQSGETADTLAAVREATNKGATVAAICNVVGSTIAREAGRGVYLHAGPEISVASTKGFTCQVTALLMLAVMFGRSRHLGREQGAELLKEIASIPDLIRQVLKQAPLIERIAAKYVKADNFFYIGRGYLYPTALEGALKLKEISYVHAEGYHAAELKHGSIALLEENVPVVAMANAVPGQDKMIGNIRECLARHAPVIAVVSGDDHTVDELTDDIIRVPMSSRYVAPLTTIVALQLFAYYFAKFRGCPIDQPRNLAKSVTVE
ncbi:MAG: glutamine--fructose-6-phosphate transaminase (isomerizing) [Lentisphaerae bacterium]|nr:glutamine--fructose-6-phosphate transaminase (isomerizing) [Lentisphaerota bacterium]